MRSRSVRTSFPSRALLAAILSAVAFASSAFATPLGEYELYFLGGQSNMDGYGQVSELPDELRAEVPGVVIFHGNTAPDGVATDGRGHWSVLQPGHGAGFRSDGETNTYSGRFGVELTFALMLREARPGARVALVKYSRGGTSIDREAAGQAGCWDPDYAGGEGGGRGVNQYDHFLATLRHALAVRDIDGDGEDDSLVPAGIVWMQGESDAHVSEEIAARYAANLARLMDLIRAALRADDLPVVVGRIADSGNDPDGVVWTHGELVREAQVAFAKEDPRATWVDTDDFLFSDPWHYDSAGYLDLGGRFAAALLELRP